jgi:hypothetical protein
VARGGDHGLRGGRPRDGAKHGAFLPRATDTDGPAKRSPRGARERCGSGRGRAHGTCVRSRSPVASAAERSDGVRASRSGRERGGASPRREIKNRPRSAKRFHERTLALLGGFREFNSALGQSLNFRVFGGVFRFLYVVPTRRAPLRRESLQ